MFYKLEEANNHIITISDKFKFYRYDKSANLIPCAYDIATLCSPSKSTRLYKFRPSSNGRNCKYKLTKVSLEELAELSDYIDRDDESTLIPLRKKKLEELSKICNSTITKGIDIILSDNQAHHFTLDVEDQCNLNRIMMLVAAGNLNTVLYHYKDGKIQKFSLADFKKIYAETNLHISYHTTYFNLLKGCINNMYNASQISAVYYGYPLRNPADIELLRSLRR